MFFAVNFFVDTDFIEDIVGANVRFAMILMILDAVNLTVQSGPKKWYPGLNFAIT